MDTKQKKATAQEVPRKESMFTITAETIQGLEPLIKSEYDLIILPSCYLVEESDEK